MFNGILSAGMLHGPVIGQGVVCCDAESGGFVGIVGCAKHPEGAAHNCLIFRSNMSHVTHYIHL